MLSNPSIQKLQDMRLTAMADTYQRQRQDTGFIEMSFDDRLAMLVEDEYLAQKNRALERRITNARFKQSASIEDIDWSAKRGLSREVIQHITGSDWVRYGQNIIITGSTGIGKSWLACAFGQKACRDGFKALYQHTPRLFRDLFAAQADGSINRLLVKLSKLDVLIIDDWGLAQVKRGQYRDILELLDQREGKSHIFTSQYPIDAWHEIVGDPTVADAIIDRVIHNAHKLELEGENIRKKYRKIS